MESLSQFSDAFQVDEHHACQEASYPETHEPEPHVDSCTCPACGDALLARFAAEDAAEYERLAAEYPVDPEDEDWGPAESWPPSVEWDSWVVALTQPAPSLAEQVEAEAHKHRRLDTPLHDLIAGELLSLAHNIRRVQASTPVEYEARMEIIDRDVIAEAEERGWDNGYAAGLAASL